MYTKISKCYDVMVYLHRKSKNLSSLDFKTFPRGKGSHLTDNDNDNYDGKSLTRQLNIVYVENE